MTQNMTLITTTTATSDLDALARRAPATNDLLQLADWLASHGAAYLSTIERIELAERLITRRRFLIGAGALGLGVITGCGAEEAAAPTATVATTRTVEHVYGQVELPVNPQRLIPTFTSTMDYALILGLSMAAGVPARGVANLPFAEYQHERYPEVFEGLEKVQASFEPNYEQIAALDPDCILDHFSVAFNDQERYELLSQIAPTYAFKIGEEVEGEEYSLATWRDSLRQVGRGFGVSEKAESFLDDYEARAEELRGQLAARWPNATFAVVNPFPESLDVGGSASEHISRILIQDLGLTPASVVAPNWQRLSLETLPQIDADMLFLALAPQEDSLERDREVAAPYLNSPLWQGIPAVEKGQVFEFDTELQPTSPLTAAAFLDYVEQTLLG